MSTLISAPMTRQSSNSGISANVIFDDNESAVRSHATDASSVSSSEEEPHRAPDNSAIIGMACRLPGAKNPEQLWKNIIEQKDVQSKMPKNRFNIDAFYHPEGTNKGTTNAKHGYFLDDDISEFDSEFFQISGKEAESIDPQQRLLLEVVYEALENAGITLDQISDTETSVFCGSFTNDYREMLFKDLEHYPKYCVTGTGQSILANRISYFYNLHGPSVTIDTACSSSLVGFHMGDQSLRNGEADISIVVGSALHFDPSIYTTMTDLGFLSVDGRCRAFDADGKGYVRGEGICAVVLKRKSQAEIDGNNIRAIIRGTGCNHDGTKEGVTMPNSAAQEALIRRVYKNSGLSTNETQYFEAHGTGTQAGDPRETRAIGAVFAPNRDQTLYVGSVKTNIGHLEGASGLASIIKTTLSLEAKTILPNMLFNTPNPKIDFKEWKITVPTKPTEWKAVNGVRRASINSFGYGGTNAHVILEGYSKPEVRENVVTLDTAHAAMVANRPYLLPLTSHNEKAGKLLKQKLSAFLDSSPEINAADLALSLSSPKLSRHQYRSYVIGRDSASTIEKLSGTAVPWTSTNKSKPKPRIGYVFTGQGAQSFSMGRELIPMFRQIIEKCDAIFQTLEQPPAWSCLEELLKTKEESCVNGIEFSSSLTIVVQICVIELLRAWGIEPAAVCGHSAGEIPASYAAGILSFRDALACAFYRGCALTTEPADKVKIQGAMIAVGLSEAEALVELEPYKGKVVIAALNSPTSLTLSGDEPEVVVFKNSLEGRKIFVRRLAVERAYHSDIFLGSDGSVCKAPTGHAVALPSYSWDHNKYWSETRLVKSYRGRKHRHSILGAPIPGNLEKHPQWRQFLRPREIPWIPHHMIEGKVVFPAAGYLTMAIEAAIRLESCPKDIKAISLCDIAIKSALMVSDSDQGTEVLFELQPVATSAKRTSDTWYRFVINSFADNGVVNEHCYGLISIEAGASGPIETDKPAPSLAALTKRSDRCTVVQKYYEHLADIGLGYGEDFQLISGNIDSGSGFAMAPTRIPCHVHTPGTCTPQNFEFLPLNFDFQHR